MNNLTPVVRNLLIINVLVFVLQNTVGIDLNQFFAFHTFTFSDWGLFNPIQILTYMFMHHDLGHIFSNMLGLFFFGPMLEHFLGSKRFLILYLIAGVGACLLHEGINLYEISKYTVDSLEYNYLLGMPVVIEGHQAQMGGMVGASGAIFGILGAFAYLFPNTEMMLLFFPFPIKAKYFVSLYALYEIYSGLRPTAGDSVAHFAHIGGLIFGIGLIMLWNKQRNRFY
jgi:membrane associated rhomboid family serine protease